MFNNCLFRASSAGKLMVNPRSKTELLSETTKTYLLECFIEQKYGRRKELDNKYVQKGLGAEEDSLTLYSRVKKQFFKKNEEKLSNEFVCGTPDIILTDSVIDIKTSWSLHTFYDSKFSEVNKNYYYQLQTYMALTGLEKAILVYTLVDTPLTLINDEKRKLLYKMACVSDENPDYLAACEEIEKNMTFSDIPMNERIIEFHIQRSDKDIDALYQRISDCREYLNSLEPSAIIAELDKETGATIVKTA